jgi:prophage tail gpP-like protein
MPKPQETATLAVNNLVFQDWETVFVHARRGESFSYFRFTAAERDDTAKLAKTPPFNIPLWQKLQFKPGDACKIWLAGQQVIDGYIETRQVAYNANSHAVELLGKSTTAWPAKSSVDTPTGNFDGMNVYQVAQACLAKYPVGVIPIGDVNSLPFEKLQCQVGETIWDFLERIGRPRGVIIGTDEKGNFLLIGQHTTPVSGQLIEGVNIKACQCVITQQYAYEFFDVRGQHAASDDNSGPQASEMHAVVTGTDVPVNSKLITPAEQPVKTLQELYQRAANEAKWHNATIFSVTITVQGWLSDGKNVWRPGDLVYVKSPMIMCDQHLGIEQVIFTQDTQNGTQTQLFLKQPWAINNEHYDVSDPDAGSPGGEPVPQ